MIDNVAGMMNAAPTPMNARVKMSWFGESTIADAIDPSPNTIMPN